MRKFFEGHSFVGVAILLSFFLLAIFLRFFDLSSQSPWTDEIATWWYVKNLDQVFYRESHTPLFYGLLRLFFGDDPSILGLRAFVATVSVVHLIEFFFLGQLALNKKAFLFFWVLVCLNPADIVYARMARHYSWLLEGTLVYYLLWRIEAPRWCRTLVASFMGLLHLFFLIPALVLAGFDLRKRKIRDALIPLVPLCLVGLYYGFRIYQFGSERVLENVAWVKNSTMVFISSVTTQFLGDSYPRFEYFPVPPEAAALFLFLSICAIIYFRRPSAWHFLSVFIVSLLLVELAIPWVNLRVNRYLIYLSGFLFFALAEAMGNLRDRYLFPLLSLPLIWIFIFNPLQNFPWEAERVEEWRQFSRSHELGQVLVCANDYQNDYFQLDRSLPCLEASLKINPLKSFVFFDINGYEKFVTAKFLKLMDVTDLHSFPHGALMIRFDPKKPIEKNYMKKKGKK